MQLFAKFKKILRRGSRATLNFRKFKVALSPLHDASNNQGTKIRYCSKIELYSDLCFTILSCFLALMFFLKTKERKSDKLPRSQGLTSLPPLASLGSLGWSSGATLKPETGIRNPQIKENKHFKLENCFCIAFACKKNKRPSKKNPQTDTF